MTGREVTASTDPIVQLSISDDNAPSHAGHASDKSVPGDSRRNT